MNKASLIEFVAGQEQVTKKAAKDIIETVLEGIVTGMESDGKVTLVGFGTFQLVNKDARTARNPKTGAPVAVPAKIVPKFRPSAGLKARFLTLETNPANTAADETDEAAE
jgi:DNA-binding protein HU-beta